MDYKIRIAREKGWGVSPRGVYHFFPQGDYAVPEDMRPDIARRALQSGIGTRIDSVKQPASENKVLNVPENKKKQGKAGKAASSQQPGRRSRKKSRKGVAARK